ncbi:facilitated trehalose transporter Tret1-like [Leguminivora glycinivorella]|uniref:facilitated trehalose transporter Tret1-like n=1 Tax=Leguminivora glycinivorella TaxID=1035111 RepID=UPI00201051E0|nr:facilitated trehalose transporter Tret1-like [Leguminivora glycinivorella]
MELIKLKENQETEIRKGHTYMQWIVAIIANSSLLTYGLQAGWISPMTQVLQSAASPAGAPLSDRAVGLVASLLPLCAMAVVPVYAFVADRLGRKAGIMCITVPHAISWLLKLFWPSPSTLIIARVCSGVAAGGCFNVIPMYTKEISQDHIRGVLGSLLVLLFNVGALLMFVLGAYCDYYTVLYAVTGVPFLSFFLIMMCPESPGFLVKKGRYDEAVKVIAKLRGLSPNDKSVQSEADAMRKEEEYYKSLPALSLTVILKDRAWRKGYTLAALMMAAQTLCGNFALLTHGAGILAGSGAQVDPALLAISLPAVMLLGSLVSIAVIERIGRRTILGSSFLVSACAQTCLATALLLQARGVSAPAWLPLLAVVATMFVYSFGVLPVPYIIITEMFNIQIRAKLLSLIVVQAWLLTFVQLAAFGPLAAGGGGGGGGLHAASAAGGGGGGGGLHAAFFAFAAVNLLGALLMLAVPETRARSLDEIETELRN